MTTRPPLEKNLPHALIFAGALPFIAGAGLLLLGVSTLPLLGNVTEATAAYGLVITVFLTGIHWGQQLSLGHAASGLFVSSNIIAVMVWLCWLMLSPGLFMVVLVVPLVALLCIDFMLNRNRVIDKDYLRSRVIITTIVICCLVAASASS